MREQKIRFLGLKVKAASIQIEPGKYQSLITWGCMLQFFTVFTKAIPIEPKRGYAAKAIFKCFEEIQNC